MNAANRAAPTTPPTVAPAIVPACDLCCAELWLEDAEDVDDGWVVEGPPVGVDSGRP